MQKKSLEKAKISMSSPQKTDKKELNKLELKALDKWRKRKEERVGPPKFEKGRRENEIVLKEEIAFKIDPQMMETTGKINELTQSFQDISVGCNINYQGRYSIYL